MSNISLRSYIFKQLNDDLKSSIYMRDSFSVAFRCARDDDFILPLVQEWYNSISKTFLQYHYSIDEPEWDDEIGEPSYWIWFHPELNPTLPDDVFPVENEYETKRTEIVQQIVELKQKIIESVKTD